MALSSKQRCFVEEYLQCWNATQAAIAAGYSERTARMQGSRLLTNDDIQELVQQRLREKSMTADEVLQRLADHARGDMGEFITHWGNGFKIDLEKAEKEGKLHLIRKMGWNKFDKPEIELYDAQSALNLLGKHFKLFTDRQEITGKDGEPIEIVVKGYATVSPDDWDDADEAQTDSNV